jgi:hypothetical protein
MLRAVLAISLLVVATGCDSGSSDAAADDTTTTSTATVGSTTNPSDNATTTAAGDDAATTTTVIEDFEIFLPGIDVPEIEQLTPTTGVGGRPLIEWSSHEGAVDYELTVFGASGTIYWSAIGPETSIYLGGAPASDQSPGPQIQDGMAWAVVALDADGGVVAQSRIRPIAP